MPIAQTHKAGHEIEKRGFNKAPPPNQPVLPPTILP